MPRLRKRGKAWFVDFRAKGKRFRKSVGTVKHIAEAALKDIEVKIAKGEYLGVYDEPQILFRDYANEYLAYSKANKNESSYDRDQISIMHLNETFGSELLNRISPAMIERYKQQRLEVVKPATVNRELSCLKHMFTIAQNWGYVREHPVKKVKLLTEPPGRTRWLTKEEMNRLLNECKGMLRSIVFTALNTGMRKSEILNLTWDAVDFTNRTITLRKTKNNKVRDIRINEALYQELLNLYRTKRSLFVFSKLNGEPFKYHRQVLERALSRAGIVDFTFHDLRHTFASHLVMQGVSIPVVQKLLGHKSIQMTMRYAHLSPEYEQDAVDRLGALWAQEPSSGFNQGKTACNTMGRARLERAATGLKVRCSTN